MLKTHIGEFVYVIDGGDKGKCFIILTEDDKYVYLCNGKGRKVTTPKKNSVKHISFTGKVSDFIKGKAFENKEITNNEIKREISKFLGYIK